MYWCVSHTNFIGWTFFSDHGVLFVSCYGSQILANPVYLWHTQDTKLKSLFSKDAVVKCDLTILLFVTAQSVQTHGCKHGLRNDRWMALTFFRRYFSFVGSWCCVSLNELPQGSSEVGLGPAVVLLQHATFKAVWWFLFNRFCFNECQLQMLQPEPEFSNLS